MEKEGITPLSAQFLISLIKIIFKKSTVNSMHGTYNNGTNPAPSYKIIQTDSLYVMPKRRKC